MNDSRPPEPDKLIADGPIDVAFLQFSGAIWYPMVYDYPDNAQHVLGHKKRVAQSARAFRYIEVLDPAFVVPSAGPPCFLDDDLFEHNDIHGNEWNTFPDQPTFLRYIEEQGRAGGRLMLPGTVADIAPGRMDLTHPVDPATIFDDKRAYLEAYQARKRDVIADERARWKRPRVDLLAELQEWWHPLLEQADMICAGINQPVLLDCEDEQLVIDFEQRVVRRPVDDENPRYQFAVPRELIDHLVHDKIDDWVNELFLSMRFTAHRRGPYNDYIYTWFKCLNQERLQYAEGFYAEHGPTQGTFELAGYNVQRRCPHMKADLTRFAIGRGRGHDLRPARLAVGPGDRGLPDLGRPPAVRPAGRRADGDDAPGGTTGGQAPDLAALAAATSDVETAAMIAGVERDDD